MADDLELAVQVRADVQDALRSLNRLEGRTQDYAKAANKADDNLTGFQRTLRNTQNGLSRTASLAGRAGKALGVIGTAATGAAAGAAYFVDQGLQTVQTLQDLEKQTGINTTKLQEWEFAVRAVGGSQQRLHEGLREMVQRMHEARVELAEGGGEAGEAARGFQLAGIRIEELESLSPAQVFDRLRRAIAQAEDEQRAMNIAAKAFGEEDGRQLVAQIRKAGNEWDTFTKRAHDAGFVLSEEVIRNADKAANQLDLLKAVVTRQFVHAIAELGPQITGFTSALADDPERITEFAERVRGLAETFATAAENTAMFVGSMTQLPFVPGDIPASTFGGGIEMPDMETPEQAQEVQRGLRERRADVQQQQVENRQEIARLQREGPTEPKRVGKQLRYPDGAEERAQRISELRSENQKLEESERNLAKRIELTNKRLKELEQRGQGGGSEGAPDPIMPGEEGEDGGGGSGTVPTYSARDPKTALTHGGPGSASEAEFEDFQKRATRAAKEQARAQAEQRQQMQRFAESVKNTVDPTREYRQEIARVRRVQRAGYLSTEEATKRIDQLKEEMRNVDEEAKQAFGGMSEFAIQARRNIESELGDTLYKTMTGQFDNIAQAWTRMLQRMVAEAAAAEIMQGLTGEGQKGGGLLNTAMKWGATSLFGGGGGAPQTGDMGPSGKMQVVYPEIQHTGGIAGSGGNTRAVPPGVFDGAHRFATGGIAGLRPDEVPIIAHRREEVVTPKDPRHRANGGADPVNVTVNLQDPKDETQARRSGAQAGKAAARELQRARRRNL